MPDDDSYDLLPHRQINELQRQIDELKAKQDRASPKELVASMDSLAKTINSLMNLFQQASQDLKYQLKEEELASGKGSVHEKLDRVIDQNRIIANGMVAVSDMVKEFARQKKPMQQKPNNFPPRQPGFQQQMPQMPKMSPNMQQQPNMMYNSPPPMPQMPVPNFNEQMPDIPLPSFEEPEKKKGIFGMFRKGP